MDLEKKWVRAILIIAICLVIGVPIIYVSSGDQIMLLVVVTVLCVAKAKANLRKYSAQNKSTTTLEGESK